MVTHFGRGGKIPRRQIVETTGAFGLRFPAFVGLAIPKSRASSISALLDQGWLVDSVQSEIMVSIKWLYFVIVSDISSGSISGIYFSDILCWHSISAFFLIFYMATIVAFFLASILAFYHIFWHSIRHSFWHSIWHLCRHSFWHLSWHFIIFYLAFYLTVYSVILSDYSGILFGINSGVLFSRSQWAVLEVQQCPLRSGARGARQCSRSEARCVIWRSQLRFGSAYWSLELAV